MRSVSRIGLAMAAPALAASLAGCVTTQEKNSWLLLRNARTLATETPVRVTRENPEVRVTGVQFVDGKGATAVAVSLRNVTRRPLTDLPISVGVLARGHKPQYLNRAANLDYYDTHISAIPAAGLVTWVVPSIRDAHVGERPFALVGVAHSPASTTAPVLPQIALQARGSEAAARLLVSIANHSSLPQYGLQVYAVARRGGRDIGVARAGLGELGGDRSATVALTFVGEPGSGTPQLYAPPTIFK